MPPDETSRFPVVRTAVWAVVLLAGVGLFGRAAVGFFRPPDRLYADFVQEWLSARNAVAGHPVYEPQSVAFARYFPDSPVPDNLLAYNAHPPAAVLAALPFAPLDYRTAHFAWNGVTFLLFVIGIGLAVRELAGGSALWAVVPVLAVLVWAEPVRATLAYGQLNFLLAALLLFGWVADRRGYQALAGVFVGLAAGVKLFPGFMLVYFLFAGRWRAVVAMAVAAAAVNGLALVLFGVSAFETYIRDVMPALADFQRAWRNLSINGFVLKLLDPHPAQAGPEVMRSPQAARAVVAAAALGITGVVAWSGWRAGRTADPDRGWAVAVVGMLLVSPIAWTHYFVILAVPLAVLAARLPTGPLRWVGWAVVLGMCLPDVLYWAVSVSAEHRRAKPADHHIPLSPTECLTGVAVPFYLTLALFALTCLIPSNRVTPASAPAGEPAPPP